MFIYLLCYAYFFFGQKNVYAYFLVKKCVGVFINVIKYITPERKKKSDMLY